ncbi:hypothetical protein Q6670_004003 [Salmonella enterica]|nr:hypothetical protein [Salmonella enterica]
MKHIITAALLLATSTAYAAPNPKTGVDCDAIASAGLSAYAAHDGVEDKSLGGRLDTGCKIGIGYYLMGKGIQDAVMESASAPYVGSDPIQAAAVLSAVSQGWLYASAHGLNEGAQ